MTLRKMLNLSETQLPHLYSGGDTNSTYIIGLMWGFDEANDTW